MKRRRPSVALFCAFLGLAAACNAAGASQEDLHALRSAQLRTIARKCGLPPSVFKLVGIEDLHIQPPPEASYRKVDCLLRAVKKAHLPMKMGFVGNEAYQPEENDAAPH